MFTKSVSAFPILVLFAPAPINNNGLFAYSIIDTASAITSSTATAYLKDCTG
ncbi:hypothetical protein [Aliarcobacter butzleri]|uniref:hypothetical protein n=1 Tax=Aliarcobacter butzleri TaxID=28197 RepID=UPI003B21DB5B